MNPIFILCFTIISSFTIIVPQKAEAQCGTGYTRDTLNWDYLDFFPLTNNYTSFVSTGQSQAQRFAFGVNRITLTHNYTGNNAAGENDTHTGQAGSFGFGQNVEFLGNGTIGMNFSDTIADLKFSLYDIDRNQRVTITAFVGSTPAPITLSVVGGSIITIGANNASPADAKAGNVSENAGSAAATLNVQITGSVTSLSVVISETETVSTGNASNRETGVFWLSDISACNRGTFPVDYYNISRPFTGQPSYVIAARNDSVYYVDVATGRARLIFRHTLHNRINSLAYDPYRHFIYFTHSLSGPGGAINSNERTLRRYDYDMDTVGIVATDIRNLGMPTFDNGVESGGAAFYNGSLYLGVESGSSASNESIIWRLNFDNSYAPVGPAVQVFGINGDEHDWADFGISNGILYDFNGKSGSANFYHLNMATGSVASVAPTPSTLIPRQVGVDWTGALYNIGSSSTISAATIAPYSNGAVNTAQEYSIVFNGSAPVGSWGDAAEAFKPKTDFGDAPASYDPAGSDPATHEVIPELRLGTNSAGIEWNKKTSADATGDGAEEDGVAGLQVITAGTSNFFMTVSVFNNTGQNATLGGWIDANGDGVYQASEGRTVVVPSTASQQSVFLSWTAINVTVPANSTTFFRLRITSASHNMTTANPTGYYRDGEVEDFPMVVSLVLPETSVQLRAQKITNNTAQVSWKSIDESNILNYELEKSFDGTNWFVVYKKKSHGLDSLTGYTYQDDYNNSGTIYYRINCIKSNGSNKFSNTGILHFDAAEPSLKIFPNPSSNHAVVSFAAAKATNAKLRLIDAAGRVIHTRTIAVSAGQNVIHLDVIRKIKSGQYNISILIDNQIQTSTIVVAK